MDDRRLPYVVLAFVVLGLASSCDQGTDDRPACVSQIQVDGCTPLYPAEFSVLFSQVFSVTCASVGVSCHGDLGQMGGLAFVTEDQSYAALLGLSGEKRRVVPGDPACSELVVRLDLPGHAWSMPPSAPLDERTRCSIRRWIAGGALSTPGATP